MAFVATDACVKDFLCADACPVDCIHPKADAGDVEAHAMVYINPAECIDCGACVPVCPESAIFSLEELPADKAEFAERNAAYFA